MSWFVSISWIQRAVRPFLVCLSRGSMLSLLWRSLVALTGMSHLVTPFRLAFLECLPTVVLAIPLSIYATLLFTCLSRADPHHLAAFEFPLVSRVVLSDERKELADGSNATPFVMLCVPRTHTAPWFAHSALCHQDWNHWFACGTGVDAGQSHLSLFVMSPCQLLSTLPCKQLSNSPRGFHRFVFRRRFSLDAVNCVWHPRSSGNPRVEAGLTHFSLIYGMVLIITLCWLISTLVRYEPRQHYTSSFLLSSADYPVVSRDSLDDRRKWLVDLGGSATLALHSVWKGQHSKSQGVCTVQHFGRPYMGFSVWLPSQHQSFCLR